MINPRRLGASSNSADEVANIAFCVGLPGCSDGRFNAPKERRKAGETARTLHHYFTSRHDLAFLPPSFFGKAIKGLKQQKQPKARQDRILTLGF